MAQKTTITLEKYVADEGMYFCNSEQRIIASELFLGKTDSIENWPEIDEEEKNELEKKWKAEAEQEAEANDKE